MSQTEKVIATLQTLATGATGQANHHVIAAQIFASQGFTKLSTKYTAHATEEQDFAGQFMARILDLNGQVQHEAQPAQPVFTEFSAYLKAEAAISQKGITALEPLLDHHLLDITSYDLVKAYVEDEVEDLNWTQQQLDMLTLIGKQNYLTQML
ncbi:ferritin-like domain-containing protein [Loigolactobacillus jiayinensis]|uniref:Bacterioferritin n=1 Tax=Loigolactobacillus jiayinensis TaxID=2486016 RepID=A0ABW1RJI5_9LACO|nr:ferritin-like domain-containing protein [Loigolactobacillus jiayinensis]